MREKVGYPYDHFPSMAFWVFRGGLAGWASICGAIPPAVSVMSLMLPRDRFMDLSDELMAWYQQFPFPEYQPPGRDLVQVPVNSSLCHVSVTKWMQAAGVNDRGAPERGDRCGGLSADVAKFTAQMLNEEFEVGYARQYSPAAVVDECLHCHQDAPYPTLGKEDCLECHTDVHEDWDI